MVPRKDPNADRKLHPLPWARYSTIENIKRVADYWCGGDGEKARRLPPATFIEVLAAATAKQKGKEIAEEEAAKDTERRSRAEALRRGSIA